MALSKVRDAFSGLGSSLLDATKETVDAARSFVASELSSAAKTLKQKDPQGKGKSMLKDIIVSEKPVPSVTAGEIVVLDKGANISIDKAITTVGCGIEWDEVKTGPEFDADVSCLLVDNDGPNELIYFGTAKTDRKILSKCGGIYHTGDNLTGADDAVAGVAVNEDDETIFAQLSDLPASVDKVIFFVNIYQAESRKQNFGTTGKMQARLYDVDTGHVFMTADLMEDNATQTSMVIGEFYRKDGQWKYKNMAQGGKQSLQNFANAYN